MSDYLVFPKRSFTFRSPEQLSLAMMVKYAPREWYFVRVYYNYSENPRDWPELEKSKFWPQIQKMVFKLHRRPREVEIFHRYAKISAEKAFKKALCEKLHHILGLK